MELRDVARDVPNWIAVDPPGAGLALLHGLLLTTRLYLACGGRWNDALLVRATMAWQHQDGVMENENIRAVREHFEAGRSVCPFAASRPVRYAGEREPLVSLLSAMERQEAAVIVATRSPATFVETREWAYATFISALRAAVVVSYPLLTASERRTAVAGVERELRDDASPTFPMIGLRDRPLITICMAPIYPAAHPRFAPQAVLVLVHEADVAGIQLPRVREAMIRQHGTLYDANQIVLPLPGAPSTPR